MTVFIVGPTGVGKSDVAVGLALAIGGEIISADSMQIYRELNIGTAKLTSEEMLNIPHHLIDIIDIGQPFGVAAFQERAKAIIADITARGKVPIVCGGTGLFINALLYNLDFSKPPDFTLRQQLENECESLGLDELYKRLQTLSPADALRIHPRDQKRILRRLEVLHLGEEGQYNFDQKKSKGANLIIGLNMDREKLYSRINLRTEKMVDSGLIAEASALYHKYGEELKNIRAIGYREVIDQMDRNELDKGELIKAIAQNTRHYAKRQLTWFRRNEEILWINILEYSCKKEIIDVIINKMNLYNKTI